MTKQRTTLPTHGFPPPRPEHWLCISITFSPSICSVHSWGKVRGGGWVTASLSARFCSVDHRDRRSARRSELRTRDTLRRNTVFSRNAFNKIRALFFPEAFSTCTALHILNGLPPLSPPLKANGGWSEATRHSCGLLTRRRALLMRRWERAIFICFIEDLRRFKSIIRCRGSFVQDCLDTDPLPKRSNVTSVRTVNLSRG